MFWLQEYHKTLCTTLNALGRKEVPTLEEINQMREKRSFYATFGVISEAAVMTADPNCGFALDEAMKGKLPGRRMYSEFFRKIVKWEFPILERMGAFDCTLP